MQDLWVRQWPIAKEKSVAIRQILKDIIAIREMRGEKEGQGKSIFVEV